KGCVRFVSTKRRRPLYRLCVGMHPTSARSARKNVPQKNKSALNARWELMRHMMRCDVSCELPMKMLRRPDFHPSKRCRPEHRKLLASVIKSDPEARKAYKAAMRLGVEDMHPDYMLIKNEKGTYDQLPDPGAWIGKKVIRVGEKKIDIGV